MTLVIKIEVIKKRKKIERNNTMDLALKVKILKMLCKYLTNKNNISLFFNILTNIPNGDDYLFECVQHFIQMKILMNVILMIFLIKIINITFIRIFHLYEMLYTFKQIIIAIWYIGKNIKK